MYRGSVKSIVAERGFGFISSSQFPGDVFFHKNEWRGEMEFDERLIELPVEFDSVTTGAERRH